jgi:transposase
MKGLCSTRDAAKKLGVNLVTLQRHIAAKTIKVPPLQKVGGVTVRLWSRRDIDHAGTILRKVRPGRKKKVS